MERLKRLPVHLFCSCREKMREELRVWHLIVAMGCMFWFMYVQFTNAMREVYAIRQEVEEQQAANSKMIIDGLELLGVPIKDLINDSTD